MFIHIQISVQYRVIVAMAFYAYYRLSDPSLQIRTYVFDVVRAEVPRMTLDELFASKSQVADAIHNRLREVMKDYGYEIAHSLITNITPNPMVKARMNEIEAARRMKEAAGYKAEGGT